MTDENRQLPTETVSHGKPPHFDLSQLSAVMMDRKNIPVGFFVSTALWTALAERFRYESSDNLAPIPNSFHGVKIERDPSLADTEFDVALTEDAWSMRLAVIRQLNTLQRPEGGQ